MNPRMEEAQDGLVLLMSGIAVSDQKRPEPWVLRSWCLCEDEERVSIYRVSKSQDYRNSGLRAENHLPPWDSLYALGLVHFV